MVKEIEIIIDENGNISLDLKGFNGTECIKETEELEKSLGIVKKREKKPEYNKRVFSNTQNNIRSMR